MELVLGVLLSVLVSLVASELYDRGPKLARRAIQIAARRLPSDIRARYEEEWLAHLDECDGKLSKLCHGIECLLCARVLGKVRVFAQVDEPRAELTLDLQTARYFFASLVNVLGPERSEGLLRIWSEFSGETELACSEADLKDLRSAADIATLRKMIELVDMKRLDEAGSKGVNLNVSLDGTKVSSGVNFSAHRVNHSDHQEGISAP